MKLCKNEDKKILNKKKVWNPTTLKWMCIFLSTFPVMPLYILNFYRLEHPKKQQNTIFGVGVTMITTGLSFVIPVGTIISFIIFMVNIGVAIYFSSEQRAYFLTYIENGGEKASSILACIIGILIFVVLNIVVGQQY